MDLISRFKPVFMQSDVCKAISQVILFNSVKAEIYFYDSVTPWSRSCLDGLVFIYGSPKVVGVAKH